MKKLKINQLVSGPHMGHEKQCEARNQSEFKVESTPLVRLIP